MTDYEALAREAEDLLRRIAPTDLAGVPLYVVRTSELPDDLGGNCGVCGGFTSEIADLVYRDVIGRRWVGRGGCVVVNDRMARRDGWSDPDGVRNWFLTVAAHELAHVLQRPEPFSPIGERVAPADLRDVAVAMLSPLADPETSSRLPLRESHDATFVRLALHVAHRAAALGEDLCDTTLLSCGFWLSPAKFYRAALGDELGRMAHLPFAEIRRAPLPAEFLREWETDAAEG